MQEKDWVDLNEKERVYLAEEAEARRTNPYSKRHSVVKSSKGKFQSNQQPPKKKRKKG